MSEGKITIESARAQQAIGAAAIASGGFELRVLHRTSDDYYITRGWEVLSSAETKWGAEWYLGWLLWSCDKSVMCPVDTVMRRAPIQVPRERTIRNVKDREQNTKK